MSNTTKVTGGASAGHTNIQLVQKSMIWIIVALIGIMGLIWVTILLKGKGESIGNWLTQSPTDIVEVEGHPGQYRVRGVQPQTVQGTQNPQTSVAANQTTYQNPMPINDWQWNGVQCFQGGMRITWHILTPGVWWQVRFDGDDGTIMDLYPKDWKSRQMLVITNSYNLQEWRVKPGSTNTHALVAWEITPDTGVPPQ